MMKFLRKYQALIMAIGASLLMVAFLLPQAIQQLSHLGLSRKALQITYDGHTHTIRSDELNLASRELSTNQDFYSSLYNIHDVGAIIGFDPITDTDPGANSLKNAEHWLLLSVEAQRAGLLGGITDGDKTLQLFASDLSANGQMKYEVAYNRVMSLLAAAAGQSNMTMNEALKAIGKVRAFNRLITGYRSAGIPSDSRLRNLADAFYHRSNVTVLFLDATKWLDEAPTPTEQQLQENFEKYQDAVPSENEFGIGYHQVDRVKFEHLTIDYQSVMDSITVSSLDVRKWYAESPDAWRDPKKPKPPFEQVGDEATTAYKRIKAEEKMSDIERVIRGELVRVQQNLPHEGDYRVLPPDWAQKRLSFEDLRQEIVDQFHVKVEYVFDASKWYSDADLRAVAYKDQIKNAQRLTGTEPVNFQDLVASIKEFGHVKYPGLQVGLAEPVMLRRPVFNYSMVGTNKGLKTDGFIYRIVAADPARPAKNLDEVRDEVVRNVKRMEIYDRLQKESSTWLDKADKEGLEDLAKSLDLTTISGTTSRLDPRYSTIGKFVPMAVGVLNIGPQAVDDIFTRINQIGILTPLDSVDPKQCLLTAPVPAKLGLVIIRIDSQTPISHEYWDQIVDQGIQLGLISGRNPIPLTMALALRDFDYKSLKPFSFDTLKTKYQYKDLRPEDEQTQ